MIKRMFHQILFSSLALLPMFVLGLGSAASYAAGKHPIDLFRGERHPTEVEFRVTSWLSLLAAVSTVGRESVVAEISRDY